jgi:hypothetical protein
MSEETKNQAVVRGLRELANFLEQRPALRRVDFVIAHGYVERYNSDARREFAETIKALGSCKKSFDDSYINAEVEFSGGVKLGFRLDREAVCKKVVVWDCGDASLLKELGLEEVAAQ